MVCTKPIPTPHLFLYIKTSLKVMLLHVLSIQNHTMLMMNHLLFIVFDRHKITNNFNFNLITENFW
jgi:hypothetical protein